LGIRQRLVHIATASINKVEGIFDSGALCRPEPCPTQPDNVEPRHLVVLGTDRKGRNVFAEPTLTLANRQPTDADELMKNCTAPDENAVLHHNITSEERVVRQHDIVSDCRVMPEMRAAHQETAVANGCGSSFRCASMNGAIFADPVVVADPHVAPGVGPKRKILRLAPEHCAVADTVSFAHVDGAADDRMSVDNASFSDMRTRFDDGIRTDLHVVSHDRFGMQNCGGVNIHAAKNEC
jgi:hypothetical protein